MDESLNSKSIQELLELLAVAISNGQLVRVDELRGLINDRLKDADRRNAALAREFRRLVAEAEGKSISFEDDEEQEESGLESFKVERSERDEKEEGRVFPVWFGTNRRPDDDKKNFGPARHPTITRGRVDVWVPKAHRFGETGTSWWTKIRRFDLRDDTLRMQDVSILKQSDFTSEIRAALAENRNEGRTPQALVFIHGFNVTFEQAAIQAAQIGVDLKVPGPTAFYSWPSRGGKLNYIKDEATIDASERAMTEFLLSFVEDCNGATVNLIAHSMGNRGLMRSLQRIAGKVKFGQIFLAAPDIDADLFRDLAGCFAEPSKRTTLYTSDGDKAVYLSEYLHDAPRAGYFTPFTTAKGIDTLAVQNFNVDWLGHSYYAQAEALLHDMYDLMKADARPGERQRIGRMEQVEEEVWTFRR